MSEKPQLGALVIEAQTTTTGAVRTPPNFGAVRRLVIPQRGRTDAELTCPARSFPQ